MRTTLVIPPLAVLVLAGLAHASAPSHIIEMEIVDTPKSGATKTARYAVAVVEDRGWFANDGHDAANIIKVSARLDRDRSANLLLQLQVHRHGDGDVDIDAAQMVSGSSRTLMGRVERDTGLTEVFAVVR
jgi:hypothetical protein